MVTDQPPILEPIWRRIREFLVAGRGGQIVLNVAPGGRVLQSWVRRAEQLFLKREGVKNLVVEREKKHPTSMEETEMKKILMFLVVPAILAGSLAVAYAAPESPPQAPRSDDGTPQAPRSATGAIR